MDFISQVSLDIASDTLRRSTEESAARNRKCRHNVSIDYFSRVDSEKDLKAHPTAGASISFQNVGDQASRPSSKSTGITFSEMIIDALTDQPQPTLSETAQAKHALTSSPPIGASYYDSINKTALNERKNDVVWVPISHAPVNPRDNNGWHASFQDGSRIGSDVFYPYNLTKSLKQSLKKGNLGSNKLHSGVPLFVTKKGHWHKPERNFLTKQGLKQHPPSSKQSINPPVRVGRGSAIPQQGLNEHILSNKQSINPPVRMGRGSPIPQQGLTDHSSSKQRINPYVRAGRGSSIPQQGLNF